MSSKLSKNIATNQASATMRYVSMSPQKVRLVADLVRGKKAVEALTILRFTPKAGAEPISKVIASALANAAETKSMNPNDLVISQIFVDGGPIRGWRRFAARGRFRPIQRKSCHISVVVGEGDAE